MGVILFAKCAKSRRMEGGRPDGGGWKVVHAGHGTERLGIWSLENTDHPFAIGREIAADRRHPVQVEALGLCGQPRNVFRGQRLRKLTLEDDVLHESTIPRKPGGLRAQTKV